MLANKATEMLHGRKESENSEKLAKSTFNDNSSGENLPSIKIKKDILKKNIVEIISHINNNISKSEIRRLINSNGVKINNMKVDNDKFIINQKLFEENGFIKLSIGKKKHFKITN